MADKFDEFLELLRGEYVEDANDQLNQIESCANQALASDSPEETTELMVQLRRAAHTLKGTSGTVDYPIVVMIMHKMEDYLAVIDDQKLTAAQVRHIEQFVDAARKYADFEIDQSADCSAMIKALPNVTDAHEKEAEETATPEKTLHAMLIIESKSAARIFEHELTKHNLTVSHVRSPFQALEMIIRTQPDLVITSAVLSGLTGVDIAAALRAMPTTAKIPVSILTSFERGHADLAGIDDTIPLIRKNNMSDDVDDALKHYKLAA